MSHEEAVALIKSEFPKKYPPTYSNISDQPTDIHVEGSGDTLNFKFTVKRFNGGFTGNVHVGFTDYSGTANLSARTVHWNEPNLRGK